jgi:hypothetical protein
MRAAVTGDQPMASSSRVSCLLNEDTLIVVAALSSIESQQDLYGCMCSNLFICHIIRCYSGVSMYTCLPTVSSDTPPVCTSGLTLSSSSAHLYHLLDWQPRPVQPPLCPCGTWWPW